MKLVPYKGKLGGFYKRTSNYAFLKEFMDSGLTCAEVKDYSQADAKSCAASLRATIKRYDLFNVRVSIRGDHVYLIRDEI